MFKSLGEENETHWINGVYAMATQNIEVEGLPDGWAVKEVHIDPDQYNKYVGDDGCLYWQAKIKMEKIQPRRMIFDEIMDHSTIELTDHLINGVWCREAKDCLKGISLQSTKLNNS